MAPLGGACSFGCCGAEGVAMFGMFPEESEYAFEGLNSFEEEEVEEQSDGEVEQGQNDGEEQQDDVEEQGVVNDNEEEQGQSDGDGDDQEQIDAEGSAIKRLR
jgi:hypothetical protein